tara:strand:- start:23498 stop:24628 length:1131 start_codon:yes stop_codon:yes gene_type:complete
MSDTYDNLKDGAISDFEFIFKEWKMDFYDYYNKQSKTLTWFGKKIQFRYLDNNKSNKGKGPRRGILYINEGNRVGWEAVKHYVARSKEVYVDFNPDFEFWAHKELLPRDNCERIIVTYKDNEMCPPNEVNYIESRRDNVEWFKVYGLGQTGTYSERRVYQYQIVDEIPKKAKRLPSGMDFGQSPDPTCRVDMWLDGIDLYLDEIFSENNLMPEKIQGAERDSIVDRMDQLVLREVKSIVPIEKFVRDDEFYLGYDKNKYKSIALTPDDILIKTEIRKIKSWLIIGDSSGKVELLNLRLHGYNARGVSKTKGSQGIGIKRMQSYNLKVTRKSENIINGMDSWLRKLDHNGNIIPEPDGHEPDTLVSARYVCLAKALW